MLGMDPISRRGGAGGALPRCPASLMLRRRQRCRKLETMPLELPQPHRACVVLPFSFPGSDEKTTELVQRFWGRTGARNFKFHVACSKSVWQRAIRLALISANPYVSISITAVEAPKGQILTGCWLLPCCVQERLLLHLKPTQLKWGYYGRYVSTDR